MSIVPPRPARTPIWWTKNAEALADWAIANLVVRRDVFGAYTNADQECKQYTANGPLTHEVLVAHFRGQRTIGLHSLSPDGRCKRAVADIDAHDEQADPGANLRLALAVAERARTEFKLSPIIIDSNGRGGFHVNLLFRKPLQAEVAHWLMRHLVGEHKVFGHSNPPETFPKQAKLTIDLPYGNWIRLPGRHHKRSHWSVAVDPESGVQLHGSETVELLLQHRGDPTEAVLAAFQAANPQPTNGHTSNGSYNGRRSSDDDDLAQASEMLQYLGSKLSDYDSWLAVGQILHSRFNRTPLSGQALDLWDRWSWGAPDKRNDGKTTPQEKWGTFGEERGRNFGTLVEWAKQAGWRPKVQGSTPRGQNDNRADVSVRRDDIAGGEVQDAPPGDFLETASDPHRLARVVLGRFVVDGLCRLVHYRDAFHVFDGSAYRARPDFPAVDLVQIVREDLERLGAEALSRWRALSKEERKMKPAPTVVRVTRTLMRDVHQALVSLASLDSEIEPPFWRDGRPGDPDAKSVLVTRNGFLDVGVSPPRLSTPDHRLFSTNPLPLTYDPRAPLPRRWLGMLESQWADDPESIDALHEVLGYLLTPDTRFHRVFLWIGPSRSGRSTVREIAEHLVGKRNVGATSMLSLGRPFGLQSILGKSVAFLGDCRTGDRDNTAVAVNRILQISGEDPVDVDRKHMPALPTVHMRTRLVLISNELPNLRDSSGALIKRYHILRWTRGFAPEQIDENLKDNILADELPGILNLALEGRRRLYERGRFLQTGSGQGLLEMAERLASPVRAFADECLEFDPGYEVTKQRVFEEWKAWAATRNYPAGSDAVFGKNLHAAYPQLSEGRMSTKQDPKRPWVYRGVDVKTSF